MRRAMVSSSPSVARMNSHVCNLSSKIDTIPSPHPDACEGTLYVGKSREVYIVLLDSKQNS